MWNIEAITGYHPVTTFWDDFSIAERFGENAVRDTFNRAFAEWKTDHVYLTELVMVLNWKIWQWYDKGDCTWTDLYDRLWKIADIYAQENLTGEELAYFYQTTD